MFNSITILVRVNCGSVWLSSIFKHIYLTANRLCFIFKCLIGGRKKKVQHGFKDCLAWERYRFSYPWPFIAFNYAPIL